MSSRSPLPALAALVLSLAACQPGPAPLSDADKAANTAATESWASLMKAGDFAGAAARFTETGMAMPPNGPALVGRPAIEKFLRAFPKVVDITITPVDIDGVGDVAYVRGTYTMKLQPEGAKEPVADAGKFVEVRRKQPNGAWLDVLDIFNSDLPLPK